MSLDREHTIAQVKTALQARGWTLHLKRRRQREYAYAARRNDSRTQDRYLAPLDDLAALLVHVATLPNTETPAVGQQPAENQVQASISDRERLRAITDLLEIGRLMSYRRLILLPAFIDPGIEAWAAYAVSTEIATLRRLVPAARRYYELLRDAGLVQGPHLERPPACSMPDEDTTAADRPGRKP